MGNKRKYFVCPACGHERERGVYVGTKSPAVTVKVCKSVDCRVFVKNRTHFQVAEHLRSLRQVQKAR